MRPVVIVHGAYHQPAHYALLAERLRSRGSVVVVPDIGMLPLTESTAVVQRAVDGLDEAPVLVLHSWGGAAGGGVGGVAHLVFLSAWVLDVDETARGLLARHPDDDDAFMAALRTSDSGRQLSIDPDRAGELFYNTCTPQVAEHAATLLRPELAANFEAFPVAARWRDRPSTYVRATRDRTWPPSLPPVLAARCTETVTLDTDHSPFLSAPEPTADIVSRWI